MTGDNILNYDYYSNTRMCIVIIPKIGGTLSILCSEFVAQVILKLPKRRVKMTNRVILALSISDIILSTTCHFFGTWPVPQGLVYGSSVKQGTCTSQVSCCRKRRSYRKTCSRNLGLCTFSGLRKSHTPILEELPTFRRSDKWSRR